MFHIFVADGATHVGDPTDPGRVGAHRVGERSPSSARLVQDAQMLDGLSLTAVLYALAFGELG